MAILRSFTASLSDMNQVMLSTSLIAMSGTADVIPADNVIAPF